MVKNLFAVLQIIDNDIIAVRYLISVFVHVQSRRKSKTSGYNIIWSGHDLEGISFI